MKLAVIHCVCFCQHVVQAFTPLVGPSHLKKKRLNGILSSLDSTHPLVLWCMLDQHTHDVGVAVGSGANSAPQMSLCDHSPE